MSLLLRILGGLALAGIGFLFVWKTEWLMQNIGTIEWAEEKLATSGGTRTFYKLLGIIIIFVGLMMMSGLLGGLILGTVGRLFTPPS